MHLSVTFLGGKKQHAIMARIQCSLGLVVCCTALHSFAQLCSDHWKVAATSACLIAGNALSTL